LVGWSVLVCAFVCAFVSAFVCSFRGLFACVLSWVEILEPTLSVDYLSYTAVDQLYQSSVRFFPNKGASLLRLIYKRK
jgi:hypothetical protein